jgi:hypothetical protein
MGVSARSAQPQFPRSLGTTSPYTAAMEALTFDTPMHKLQKYLGEPQFTLKAAQLVARADFNGKTKDPAQWKRGSLRSGVRRRRALIPQADEQFQWTLTKLLPA